MTDDTRTEPLFRPVKKTPPDRYKPRNEWTTADVIAFRRTGREPETDDFLDYVRKVHEDAGLEPPAETMLDRRPAEELSVADHLERLARHNTTKENAR